MMCVRCRFLLLLLKSRLCEFTNNTCICSCISHLNGETDWYIFGEHVRMHRENIIVCLEILVNRCSLRKYTPCSVYTLHRHALTYRNSVDFVIYWNWMPLLLLSATAVPRITVVTTFGVCSALNSLCSLISQCFAHLNDALCPPHSLSFSLNVCMFELLVEINSKNLPVCSCESDCMQMWIEKSNVRCIVHYKRCVCTK